jgi:hypothetical protein
MPSTPGPILAANQCGIFAKTSKRPEPDQIDNIRYQLDALETVDPRVRGKIHFAILRWVVDDVEQHD